MDKVLMNALADKAEDLGWACTVCDDGDVEFAKRSPAGEDFSFYVSDENVIGGVAEYAADFDADDHATMWVFAAANHSVKGVPRNIGVLLRDAEAIQAMLDELAYTLAEVQRNFI